jgi:exopolysaccharide biosynthesis polyprenyl glycosylphosphotransferase
MSQAFGRSDLAPVPEAPPRLRVLRTRPTDDWAHPAAKHGRKRMLIEAWTILGVDVAAILGVTVVVAPLSWTAFIVVAALFVYLIGSGDFRRPRVTLSVTSELPRLLARWSVPLLLVVMDGALQPVATWVFVYILAAFAAVVVGRVVSFQIIRHLRLRGYTRQRGIIVGAGVLGCQLAEFLERYKVHGIDPVGLVDDDASLVTDREILAPVSGLEEALRASGARYVLVAFGASSDTRIVDTLRSLPAGRFEIFIIPRFFELGAAAGDPLVDEIWGLPLVWLRRRASRESKLLTKRIFDVVVSMALLTVTLPFFVLAALAVRLTSRGPVFFRQQRIGRHGRVFDVLKFRSMRVNNDSDITWSVVHDRRVTPVGRVLRRTCIDELPQLFNVIKGDMSLVGPRPERPHYVEQFSQTVPRYHARHRSPVGLTGWAQIHGLRGDSSIDDRVRFDNNYIEHWSMWRDITILVRTLTAIIKSP